MNTEYVERFNPWFLSLPEGRQAVLREDKWMLASNAYDAGYEAGRADEAERSAKLREAVAAAGFGVMETSGKWSLHCTTDAANRAEETEGRLIEENIELLAALKELLPHARQGIQWLNAQMVGNLYPSINAAKLDRAEAAIAKAEGRTT